jgi:glycosyltransferase involved in cell wall biosynthesis
VIPASPSISVVIPTLNAAKYLRECLGAVRAQDYGGPVEMIIVDAGSTDGTLDIARGLEVDRILENPLKTGEAGKAVGLREAEGELVLSLDSDNIVVGSDWFRRMVEPFSDPDVVAAQPLRWDYRRQDHFITRWAALTGVGDPLTLYIGNYDHYSQLTGRWTDYPHREEERDGWLRVEIDPAWVPTIGANGYLLRREALAYTPFGEYFFDIDFAHELVQRGSNTIALVDVAIRHYFSDSVSRFYLKTRRRVDDFYFFSSRGMRSYPWTSRKKRGAARFVASTLLVVPLLVDIGRGFRRRPDPAWLFHLPACWITLAVYGTGALRGRLRPRMLDRRGWGQ